MLLISIKTQFIRDFQAKFWQLLFFPACITCTSIWLHSTYRLSINLMACQVSCIFGRSFRVAERLALPTSDHGVTGLNPAGGEILSEPKRRFIAQSLSCSPFHRLEMTEILLKGRKTLTHPSIHVYLVSPSRQNFGSEIPSAKWSKINGNQSLFQFFGRYATQNLWKCVPLLVTNAAVG